MKSLLTLIFSIIFCGPAVHSQSIIRSTTSAAGSSQSVTFNSKSYFVSQSIGQTSVIGTSTKNGYTIRQGFQQPPHSLKIGQPQLHSDLMATIYPNPFKQLVHIFFKEKIDDQVSVIMHDVAGRIILLETYEASQLITLPLAHIASGIYILSIAAKNKHLTSSLIKR